MDDHLDDFWNGVKNVFAVRIFIKFRFSYCLSTLAQIALRNYVRV